MALPPCAAITLPPAQDLARPARRSRLWAALAVSVTLHGAAAWAITSGIFGGAEAAGNTGDSAQSLPERPPVMVQLLTPADLVSEAQPLIAAAPPDLAQPPLAAEPLLPELSAEPVAAITPPPLTVLAPPVSDVGPVVSVMTPPPAAKAAPEKTAPAKPKVEKPKGKPPEKPAKKAEPAKKPSNAEAGGTPAKGSGGGAAAGSKGSAKAGLSKGQIADLKAEWGGAVRSKVDRKRSYPNAAKGAAGTVKVRLTLSPAGQLLALSVAASSGNAALDAAAVNAVQSVGIFPKAPKGLSDASYSFTLPMKFKP